MVITKILILNIKKRKNKLSHQFLYNIEKKKVYFNNYKNKKN